MDIPNIGNAANTPINETGIVTNGINVERQSPKNVKITTITIIEVKIIVKNTSFIDSRINLESSCIIFTSNESGRVLLISVIFLLTKLTTSIVFAPGSGTTWITEAGLPPIKPILSYEYAPSSTLARSFNLI